MLTGQLQAGKTTVCELTLALLRERGMQPAGVVTVSRDAGNGERPSLDVVDVTTGERQALADYRPGSSLLGNYLFHERALRWGLAILQKAVAEKRELLVVDEVGWLELWLRDGWAWALGPLSSPAKVPRALLVVRQEVLEEMAERLGRDDLVCVTVSQDNRDDLPHRLADLICPVEQAPA